MGDLNQSGSGELKNQGNEIGCGSCLIQQNKLDPGGSAALSFWT